MKDSPLAAILRDNLHDGPHDWRLPLVVDQLKHFYGANLPDPAPHVQAIILLHFRMWRQVLDGNQTEASLFRAALVGKALEAGVSATLIDKADQAVLDELMDVIRARFRRAPAMARKHCIDLLESATILVRSRQTSA